MHRAWLAAPALLLLLAAPQVAAQEPPSADVYQFSLYPVSQSQVDVPVNGQALIRLLFDDTSRDGSAGVIPRGTVPGGAPQTTLQPHYVRFRIDPGIQDSGWYVSQPAAFPSYAGTQHEFNIFVQSYASAKSPYFPFNVTAIVTTQHNGTYEVSAGLLAFSLGPASFGAQVPRSYILRPDEIGQVEVRILNLAIHPRSFDVSVAQNPCGMRVATNNGNVVPGKGESRVTASVQAPADKPWYFSEICTLALTVNPSGSPDVVQTAYASIQVNGGYLDPVWVFWVVFAILLVLLLFFLAKRRKERIEEEILGKPQKPWTIPVEALYLRALRQKDERAWYVVRHHLMEEEYRSALLWYRSYKKATRGSRRKEALVLRQEKRYERWKAAWAKDIAKPLRKADRHERVLQRRLDRKARKEHRKQLGKARKLTARMKAAHAKQTERALAKWQKQARRAEKKGLPAPERPALPEPDYPAPPELQPLALADHKWSKRAARRRAKAVRKQGDLEVRFEKADARRLARLRRKVQRLARKLDDPDFVAEHPLLKADA